MQRVLHCYTCCWYDGHIDTFLDDYKASCRINSHHQKILQMVITRQEVM